MQQIYGVLVASLVALTVMKAHADGEYVQVHALHSFANTYNTSHTNPWQDAEGGHPAASLYEHTDGMLYGTTTSNGPHQTGDATHSCSSGFWRTSHPEYFAKSCPGTVFRLNKLNETASGFAVVYAFAGLDAHDRNATGYRPYSTLVPGPSGYLYGTATQGGAADGAHAGCGVVFKFLPSHPSTTFSIVHHFCSCPSFADGATPYGSLVPDGHGDFYGATSQGTAFGTGSLFKLSESSPTTCNGRRSTVTTLHAFRNALDYTVHAAPHGTNTDGAGAFGSPVLDGTTLVGLTHFGGDSANNTASCGGGFGTVYSYETSTRTFSKVQDQACFSSAGLNTDQVSAQRMIVGSDGHYYGTAQFGGANNTGYVFKLVPGTGAVTILHSFGAISAGSSPPYSNATDGAQPMGTLVEGRDHFLYGTTYYGGSNGTGIIFQMKKTGADFLVLYTFPAAGTNAPGTFPQAGLIQGSDGRYYGTTSQGGTHGFGTVFAMERPLSFAHTFHAELNTVYESAPIRVSGLASSAIAISNGEYQIDAGPWTSAAGTVATGQTLRVRVPSSASYNTRVLATVVFSRLGNSSFGVTTKPRPQPVTEIRQPAIRNDPAVMGNFPQGWTLPTLPEGPQRPGKGAAAWVDQVVYAPPAEVELAPGATHGVELQVGGPAVLIGSAKWIGTVEVLGVSIALDGARLATGAGYSIGTDRGGSELKVETPAGGRAILTVTNTSEVPVRVRMILGAFPL